MSLDGTGFPRRDHGLRLALAVTLGLVIEISRDVVLPPLAPVIALQLLARPGPAPALRLVIGLVGIIAVSSLFSYGLATLTVGNLMLYAIGVGLFILAMIAR